MSWRIPIVVLVLLIFALLTVTLLNIGRTDIDAPRVSLGLELSENESARFIDDKVIAALETGALNNELRLRLQRPIRTVAIDTFRIDNCEVTQENYERFVQWYTPIATSGSDVPPEWLRSESTGHRTAGRLNSPASGVSHRAATRYCFEIGGRLPTSEELEIAARGAEGRLYPWGDDWRESAWPYLEPDRNAQQTCGKFPETDTPSGIHDLANNVMEWTSGTSARALLSRDEYVPVHGAPTVRTRARELYALSAAWLEVNPNIQSHHLGFRCVYDEPPFRFLPWDAFLGRTTTVRGGVYQVGIPPEARVTYFVTKIPQDAELPIQRLVRSTEQFAKNVRVDRCEVSREDYAEFLNDPLVKMGLYRNTDEPSGHSYVPLRWDEQQDSPEYPVTGVSWWSADAFARWSGGRLPTAEEWRAVAAGPEGRLYPWGDIYESGFAASGDDETGKLVVCDDENIDETTTGVRHLAGNVSEWTRSVTVDRGAITMWVQGGNWMLPGVVTGQTIFGRKVTLNHRSETIGFRVVYD